MTPPDPIEPLDTKLAALVAAEREVGASPAAGKDAVAARLEASLFGGGGGGGSGMGGSGGEPSTSARASVGAASPLVARLVPLAAAFALGAGVSAEVLLSRPAEMRVEVRERIVEIRVPASVESAAPDAPPSSVAPAPHPVPSAHPLSPAASVSPDSLVAERAILDTARTAIGRKDGVAALESVRKHETKYPNGKLTEEREAIAVQALVQLGRRDEASERGRRFATRWPSNVLLPVVKAALEGQ